MKPFYSQIGQDQYYIENISKHRRGGRFLDIGANDGTFDSNTAALEIDYGWTGICVEANPYLVKTLTAARPNSTVVNAAVWSSPKQMQLEVSSSNHNGVRGDLLSRVTEVRKKNDNFKQHFNESCDIVEVEATTVTDIIKARYGLPCVIDYMSLDIEGAELQALKGIDFSSIDIRFMTIEHGNRKGYLEEIVAYLRRYGYKVHRRNEWDVEMERDDTIKPHHRMGGPEFNFENLWRSVASIWR